MSNDAAATAEDGGGAHESKATQDIASAEATQLASKLPDAPSGEPREPGEPAAKKLRSMTDVEDPKPPEPADDAPAGSSKLASMAEDEPEAPKKE